MPHARIATKQATFALQQLHAELGGKILDNKREAQRLAIALAASDLKIDAPKPSVVGVAENSSDIALPVEYVLVFVLPLATFAGGVGAAKGESWSIPPPCYQPSGLVRGCTPSVLTARRSPPL
jgi:hypothetical protein